MKRVILMDSDIGNHIDDAVAMAAACSAPDLQLVGVTTTGENAPYRAQLARRLLDAYGARDVPVAAGDPPPTRTIALQGRALEVAREAASTADAVQSQTAVDLMRSAIEEHPGLTVIATAPLTNVAALLLHHPEVAQKIGRIIFMGGWSTQALPEYNLRADPEAVAQVLASNVPLTAVGYEATLRCSLKGSHVRQLEQARTEGTRFLHVLYQAWRDEARHVPPIMHDPLTVAVICGADFVQTDSVTLKVDLEPGPGRGALSRAVDGKPVEICTGVDPAAYLDWLINLVAPDETPRTESKPDPSLWHVRLREAYRVTHYAGWSNAVDTGHHHVIALVSEGGGRLNIDGRVYDLTPGCAVYLPTNQSYTLSTAEGMNSYWFHFYCHYVKRGAQLETIDRVPELQTFYPEHARTSMLMAQAERILQSWLNPWLEGSMLCQSSLLEFLAHLLYMTQERQESRNSVNGVVIKAQRFIHANSRRHMSLETLSRHVGMSKYHLARMFKDAYGVAPLQYHTELRMGHAKRLLRLGNMPVSEVAAQLGYASPNAFSRAFHRYVGVPPTEYRA